MRAVGFLFALIVCVGAVDLRHQLRRATPEWATAVTNVQASLDSRQAEVSKLTGQFNAAKGTEAARKAAYEEAQRNLISQKVIVAQATAHRNTAQRARDTAGQAFATFKAGPYVQAAQNWKQHAAQKPELDAAQKKITAAQQDIINDFPPEARARATQDLNAAQQALSARIAAYNNANVAYNAAVLTYAQHQNAFTSAQYALNSKNTELTQAQQTLAKLRQEHTTRLSELKTAAAACQACDQQLTHAKQEVVAAVGQLRVSLEDQLRALREQLFSAQQQEANDKQDLTNQEANKKKYADLVNELSAQIAKITSQYNAAQQKLSQAIADFTVAKTNYENTKLRVVSAKQSVAQAHADYNKFNVQHAPPPVSPSAQNSATTANSNANTAATKTNAQSKKL